MTAALNPHAADQRPKAKAELIARPRMTLLQACFAWNLAHAPHVPGTRCSR